MPRVTFVKAARKDNPVAKKGESYYWWKFRYGGKRYSKTRPRPSQLTQSAYFGTIYGIQETIEDTELESYEDFEALVETVREEVESLRDETQSSLDNMAEYNLEYSPTGEMLQERVDALEMIDSEIDCIDEFYFNEEEFDEPEPERGDYEDDDDGEVEYNDAYNEWEDNLSDHEAAEEDRRQQEFQQWAEEAKGELISALDQAIV